MGKLLDCDGALPFAHAMWGLNANVADKTKDSACVFLAQDNRCGIYASRPRNCVMVAAGGESCRTARQAAGLPMLEPRAGPSTELERWAADPVDAPQTLG